jgi:hypothetical protein
MVYLRVRCFHDHSPSTNNRSSHCSDCLRKGNTILSQPVM